MKIVHLCEECIYNYNKWHTCKAWREETTFVAVCGVASKIDVLPRSGFDKRALLALNNKHCEECLRIRNQNEEKASR